MRLPVAQRRTALLLTCLSLFTQAAYAQSRAPEHVSSEGPLPQSPALQAASTQGAPLQDSSAGMNAAQSEMPHDWDQFLPRGVSLGVAVMWSEGLMVGESTRTFLVPTVGYEGERLFSRGINGGMHLFKRSGIELDAILGARLEGWDASDLGETGLAAVGIDRELLKDRDSGLDAGLGVSWRGKYGKLNLDAKGDVSNASGGHELALVYRAAFLLGRGMLSPTLGVSYWSASLADYYYGTLPAEEARGVPRYRPGSAVVPSMGVSYLRPLPGGWLLVAGMEVRWLDSRIVHSPLVDDDSGRAASLFLGISRAFGAAR